MHPQVARSRAAVLAAVTELIEEGGAAAVTHQRVAQRAGVGRATVYRHWPQRVDLLADALETTSMHFLEPSPGAFATRLRADLERLAEQLNSPGVSSMAATIVERAQWDERTRTLRDRLVGDIHRHIAAASTDAERRGELGPMPDADDLFDLVIGPLWTRRMLQGKPITPALVDGVVRSVMTATFGGTAPG